MACGTEVIGMSNRPEGDEQSPQPPDQFDREPLRWFYWRTRVHATETPAIDRALGRSS
jgi:hypothetical protein